MMGGGILLMMVLPLLMFGLFTLLLIVAAGGGVTLLRNFDLQTPKPNSPGPLFSSKSCPVCNRPLQADWQVCPYDGTKVH